MEARNDFRFIENLGALTEDGVAVYDLKAHKFLYANENFLKIFQVHPGNLFSNSSIVLQIILAEDVNYLTHRYEELIKTGSINTTEFRLKLADDLLKHVSCDVIALENPSLIMALVKDISMAKKHEDFLIKYTAQKDTMLDMLTHNLSGPLQLSKDLISSLQKGYGENKVADISRWINIMQENTQQCIDIVNDFLRQEHSESSRTYVRKTRFDVLEKIKVTLDKLKELNSDKVFNITTDLANLNINSDVVKFFQIIHNVLSNAIKFTPSNGIIDIKVTEAGEYYTIGISDTGIGIPESLKAFIFEERMMGRTGLNGEKSNGLGLSIAKRLVQVMGGEIWFDSQENAGSAFYIKLPKE